MCDTFAVVHPDGVLFGKNSDREPNEPQVLETHPRREHAAGDELACTWKVIPQARRTHAVLLSRPSWMWGAEMGVNEHGLRVGNEAVFTRTHVPHEGLTGMDLVRLTLERAANVEEGIETLKSLIAAHGQGGRCGFETPGFRYHSSFLLADGREAAVVETSGRALAVERVKSGVRAISNGLSIPGFKQRHGDPLRPWVARAAARRSRVTCLAEGARTPADAIAVLRDHGEGHRSPVWSIATGAMGGPCMHAGGWIAAAQTTASLVSWVGEGSQNHFATGTSAPCLSAYKPVSVQAPLGVDSFRLWRRFEELHRLAMRAPEALTSEWFVARDALEARALTAREEALEGLWADFAMLVDHHLDRLRNAPPMETRPAWLRAWWARPDTRFSEQG